MIQPDEFNVTTEDGKATLSGVMRLPSPTSYQPHFDPIKKGIEANPMGYAIDISKVQFLNSSGINAFARLIIFARTQKTPIRISATRDIPWQKKTIGSLNKLWEKVDVEFE